MSGVTHTIRTKGTTVLAWTSLVFAAVSGAQIAGMFVGETIRSVLGAIPFEWLPILLLTILTALFIRDLIMDMEPNKHAIYTLLVIPSVAASTKGQLGDTILGWSSALLDALNAGLSDWIGGSGAVALALSTAAVAILVSQRAVKGGGRRGGH